MDDDDNKNFLIFLAIVFIVTVVALVAVLAITWRWVAEPIGTVVRSATSFRSLQSLDYNFPIPKADPTPDNQNPNFDIEVDPLNYIFKLPVATYDSYIYRLRGELLQDAIGQRYSSRPNDLTQYQFDLQIPKLGFFAPAFQGLGDRSILDRGLWIHPDSDDIGDGDLILLCYYRFFTPSDIRSCEFLNELNSFDKLFISNESIFLEFEIFNKEIVESTRSSLYDINSLSNSSENSSPKIRIVSEILDDRGRSRRLIIDAELAD